MFLHRKSKQVNYESVSTPRQKHIRPKAYLELHGPSPKIFNLGFQLWHMKLFLQKGQKVCILGQAPTEPKNRHVLVQSDF